MLTMFNFDRVRGEVFVPDTATVKQLREILFWTKSYRTEEPEYGEGLLISFSVKSDHYSKFLEALFKTGGYETSQDLTAPQ